MKLTTKLLIIIALFTACITAANAQGVANVGAKWESGNLVYYSKSTGTAILTIKPTSIDLGAVSTATASITGTTSAAVSAPAVTITGSTSVGIAGGTVTANPTTLNLNPTTLQVKGVTLASTAAQLDSYVVQAHFVDAGTAGSVFVVCPFAGTIKSIGIVNDAANTTTKTVFTAEIAGVAVTMPALEQGATDAAGTAHSVVPTAANALTAGQALELITDGGTDATMPVTVSIVIQR